MSESSRFLTMNHMMMVVDFTMGATMGDRGDTTPTFWAGDIT